MPTCDQVGEYTPPSGFDADVPCPHCDYNLRGLTVPRCPECGHGFNWEEPCRQQNQKQSSSVAALPIAFLALSLVIGTLGVAFAMSPLIAILLFLLFVLAVIGCVSALQTLFEVLIAWPFVGGITWRFYRAWWEGVLIGYGVCGTTCLLAGRPLLLTEGFHATSRNALGAWPLIFITAVASLLVQWLVVRRRNRVWSLERTDRQLLLGAFAAKVLVAIPWTCIALRGWPC